MSENLNINEKIITAVSSNIGVSKEDILSNKKSTTISLSRHICMYVISRKNTMISQRQIGDIFGTTNSMVSKAIRGIEYDAKTYKYLKTIIDCIIKDVESN